VFEQPVSQDQGAGVEAAPAQEQTA
jgi:hypothetical protein